MSAASPGTLGPVQKTAWSLARESETGVCASPGAAFECPPIRHRTQAESGIAGEPIGAVRFVAVERLASPSRPARPDTAPWMSALRSKPVAQKAKSRGVVLAAGCFRSLRLV